MGHSLPGAEGQPPGSSQSSCLGWVGLGSLTRIVEGNQPRNQETLSSGLGGAQGEPRVRAKDRILPMQP